MQQNGFGRGRRSSQAARSSVSTQPAGETLSRRRIIAAAAGTALLLAGGGTAAALRGSSTAADLVSQGTMVPGLMTSGDFTVAHHGGSADWPEMSMMAYGNSAALGADALEVSLARTADGVWFGLHDPTLDRTSGTHGFVASQHTWAQVRRHLIRPPRTARAAISAQPYLRAEELFTAYGSTHSLFVDPKVVPARHYGELFKLMATTVPHPTRTFVAKAYCTGKLWSAAAREHGYRTWGYYYSTDIATQPELLPRTQALWDLLGLNYTAPLPVWRHLLTAGKPVIGHVIPSRQAAAEARSKGARGLMISGIAEVLP